MREDNYVFIVDYLDNKGYRKTMAIYDADNTDECKKVFYKHTQGSSIKNIRKMSEYDYKHMI